MDMFCPIFLLVSFSCQSSGTIFRKREATRRFVETSEWPEQKSSESSEQLFISRTLKLGFVKVICLVCRKAVSESNGVGPLIV